MRQPRHTLPLHSSDPLYVSVTRGGAEESMHLVDVALCDADGAVLIGLGDVERPVFPRSAMKPLQSIALAEKLPEMDSKLRLSPRELSLICASHNAQAAHVEAVQTLLGRFDLSPDLLSCGAQWSGDQETLIEQARSMDQPHKIHNNCSGKHAGMLVLGHLMGAPANNYAAITHPVQQTILGVLENMTGVDLLSHPHGVDGCGAPALSAPLGNWARAFALFAGGGDLSERRATACAAIRDGVAAEPFMIAGDRRLCTALNREFGSLITAKTGAEGVFAAGFHDLGLGVMVKARDGNRRAAEVALGAVVHALGYDIPSSLTPYIQPELCNWAGDVVGAIHVTGALALAE